jgi:hypothetical protein
VCPASARDSRKTRLGSGGFFDGNAPVGVQEGISEEETTMKSMIRIYSLCSKAVGVLALYHRYARLLPVEKMLSRGRFGTKKSIYAALLLLSIPVFGQDCVILKRMGPGDQLTSHMFSFGIRGKQFQFVEGEVPNGVKWHGRLTDNDVRKLQDAGVKIVIVEPKFSATDLAEARRGCTAAPVPAVSKNKK